MPRQLEQLPPDATTLAREVAALRREMRELRAARRASYTALEAGGFKVYQPGTERVSAQMSADLGNGEAGFQTSSADGTRYARMTAGELTFGSPDVPQVVPTGIAARADGATLDITSGMVSGGSQAHILLAGGDSPLAESNGAPLISLFWDGTGGADMVVDVSGILLPRSFAWGITSVTPSAANTPTSAQVTGLDLRGSTFQAWVTPATVVPGSTVNTNGVTGVGYSAVSSNGLTVWLTRQNTTTTPVSWLVIGR
ncbi:hypothetical protein [Streptomyces sp. NPDC006997]|uniref:hypothetical protein n=1 Tax=Streptomyces sp. NPDC006997 TaxID=3155356 RepID=UPI0033EB11D3